MSTGPAPGVRSGPPIWLWIIMVPLTLAVLAGVIISSIPADPQEIYDNAMTLVEQRAERDEIETQLIRLASYPEYQARCTYLQARVEANQQRDVKAVALFREALEQSNDDKLSAKIQSGLASSLRNSGDLQGAIEAYEESISLNEEDAVLAQFELGKLYAAAGAYTLCEKIASDILERDESHKGARELRGNIRAEMRRYEEALADLELLLSTPGDRAAASPDVITKTAECMMAIREPEQVEKFATDCASLIQEPGLRARLTMAMNDHENLKVLMDSDTDRLPHENLYRAAITFGNNELEIASDLVERACQEIPRTRGVLILAEKIFKASKEEEKLKVVRANLEQLDANEKSLAAAFKDAGDNVDDFDARVEIGKAMLMVGNFNSAARWFATAALVQPSRGPELAEITRELYQPPTMFVEFPKPAEDEDKTDEPKSDEDKSDEDKSDEPKSDEPKSDEPKSDEPKSDEPKSDEPKSDEPKSDEPKSDEPKSDEPKSDEPKSDEPKSDEPKSDEPKSDEPKSDEPKSDEPKSDEPKTDEPKTDEPKTDEPKTDEPKTDEPKTDEPKTDEPKTDEPKTDGEA